MKIGFSPCPNDTFIFEALVHQRFEHGLDLLPQLEDVETLNRMAVEGTLPVTKLSFAAYAFVADHYQILSSGSALGNNCGPLLIYKSKPDLSQPEKIRVAIPGKFTTANLLLSIFYPELTNKTEFVFSGIEEAVLNGDADLGLIIHENRFTYQQKGLFKLDDMGERWETFTGNPIPLGCIAVRRDLPEEVKITLQNAIRRSIEWAYEHPEDGREYISQYAQEMSEEVQKQHIALYVNRFSLDLGEEGRAAVTRLLQLGEESGLLPKRKEPIFVNQQA